MTTSGSGGYVLETWGWGDRTVEAAAPGFIPERRDVYLYCMELVHVPGQPPPACTKKLDFRMRPLPKPGPTRSTCALTGQVVHDESNEPHDAIIQILGAPRRSGTLADSTGRYRLTGVAAGVHTVEARPIGGWVERRLLMLGCEREEAMELNFRVRSRAIE